jgi:predicted amidohydrolase YtcJ
MATEDNAVLLGYGQELGRLEPGRYADLVLLDFEEMRYPFTDDAQDPIDVLLYRGKGCHVHTVMVNGKVVVEDGKVLNVDERALALRLAEAGSRPRTKKEEVFAAEMDELKRYIASYYEGWSRGVTHRPFYSINSRVAELA